MRGIGHNQPMRIVGNGAFCLKAGVLAILCTLAFAAGAMADASSPTESEATPTPSGREAGGAPPGESTGPAAEQTPAEGAGPGTEPGPESAGTGGSPESTGSGGPSGEEPPTAPVVPETPPVVTETGEGTPVTPGPGPEATPEPTPLLVTEQGPQEAASGAPATKAGEEEAPSSGSHAVVGPESGVTQAATARAENGEAAQGPTIATVDALTPPPAGPTASGLEAQASMPSGAGAHGGGDGGAPGAMTAVLRAGSLTCELSALGGRTTDNCTVGWLGGKRFIGSSAGAVPAVGSLAAAAASAGLPPDGGHGGSAVGNAPVSPAPGPAPSGASGAAVGGASGAAPSAFLSLAGLLLLAAPRALRRLRLSCRPWLTACFVLIPERPG